MFTVLREHASNGILCKTIGCRLILLSRMLTDYREHGTRRLRSMRRLAINDRAYIGNALLLDGKGKRLRSGCRTVCEPGLRSTSIHATYHRCHPAVFHIGCNAG